MNTCSKAKSLGLVYSLFMLVAFSCKNEKISTEPVTLTDRFDIATYNKALSKELSGSRFGELRKLVTFQNTVLRTVDVKGKPYKYFEVAVYQGSQPKAVITGLIGKTTYYNTVFWVKEENGNGSGTLEVKTVSNEMLGTIEINKMKVTSTTVTPQITSSARLARSWWGCTSDCIGDCRVACGGSSDCSTLLFISNNIGVLTGQANAGSNSIAVACGISCAGNSDMDLLPQY